MQIATVTQNTRSIPWRSSDACSGSQSTKYAMAVVIAATTSAIEINATMAPLRNAGRDY